jgi:MerR family transcriptional regulator, light-induced transcriptional regulator
MDGSHFKSGDFRGSLGGPAQGESAATTMALFKTLRDKVIPQLASIHKIDSDFQLPKRSALAPAIGAVEVKRLFALLETESDQAALDYIKRQRSRGVRPDSIALDLIGATGASLQNCWSSDSHSFAEITAISGRLAGLLFGLDQLCQFEERTVLCSAATSRVVRPKVLLVVAPGGQHTLGLKIVDFLLRRSGFDCRVVASQSESAMSLQVAATAYDVLAVSISQEEQIDQTKQLISLARQVSCNKQLTVLLGGALLVNQPALASQFDVELVSLNAASLADQVAQFLGLVVNQSAVSTPEVDVKNSKVVPA